MLKKQNEYTYIFILIFQQPIKSHAITSVFKLVWILLTVLIKNFPLYGARRNELDFLEIVICGYYKSIAHFVM